MVRYIMFIICKICVPWRCSFHQDVVRVCVVITIDKCYSYVVSSQRNQTRTHNTKVVMCVTFRALISYMILWRIDRLLLFFCNVMIVSKWKDTKSHTLLHTLSIVPSLSIILQMPIQHYYSIGNSLFYYDTLKKTLRYLFILTSIM